MPYRIFILDNGSEDDETQSLLRAYELDDDISVTRLDRNHGPAAGRNRILDSALEDYELFAFLDNDIAVLAGWDAGALAAVADGHHMVQPKLLCPDLQTIERGPMRPNRDPLAANHRYVGNGLRRDDAEVDARMSVTAVGGTGIVVSEVFRRVGLYDEELHIAEDLDLSRRALSAGLSLVYEPSCEMVHDHQHDAVYGAARQHVGRILAAHRTFWCKHGLALLDPRWFHWYQWLYTHGERIYPDYGRASLLCVLRRLRRRAMMFYFMRRFSSSWESRETVTRSLQQL